MRRIYSGFRPFLELIVVTVLGLGLPCRMVAQDTAHSAQYLQQVAAAVEGYSGGGVVFVVICGRQDPYHVKGAFGTRLLADTAAAHVPTGEKPCFVEGPYYSNVSYASGVTTFGKGCNKQIDSSCPLADTSRSNTVVPISEVQSVTLLIRLKSGRTIADSFPPSNSEAIFLTMSAVDKLLIPYLVRVYGIDYAARQRQLFLRRFGAQARAQN